MRASIRIRAANTLWRKGIDRHQSCGMADWITTSESSGFGSGFLKARASKNPIYDFLLARKQRGPDFGERKPEGRSFPRVGQIAAGFCLENAQDAADVG